MPAGTAPFTAFKPTVSVVTVAVSAPARAASKSAAMSGSPTGGDSPFPPVISIGNPVLGSVSVVISFLTTTSSSPSPSAFVIIFSTSSTDTVGSTRFAKSNSLSRVSDSPQFSFCLGGFPPFDFFFCRWNLNNSPGLIVPSSFKSPPLLKASSIFLSKY